MRASIDLLYEPSSMLARILRCAEDTDLTAASIALGASQSTKSVACTRHDNPSRLDSVFNGLADFFVWVIFCHLPFQLMFVVWRVS